MSRDPFSATRTAVRAEAGDVALMPGRRGFVVSSSPSVRPVEATA